MNTLELVPSAPCTILEYTVDEIKFLETYSILIESSIHALDEFSKGNLKAFDAHVGDTACQIRAYKFYKLYNDELLLSSLTHLKRQFIEILSKVKDLILVLKFENPKKRKVIEIGFLVEQYGLKQDFDDEIFELAYAFFLAKYTLFEKDGFMTQLNKKSLKKDLMSSNRFVERLVKHYQQKLTELSYSFLVTLAQQLKIEALLEYFKKQDGAGRVVVPTFLSGYLILKNILLNNEKFSLVARNKDITIKIIFAPNPSKTNFDVYIGQINHPIFTIAGEMNESVKTKKEFIESLKHANIFEILLTNFAEHPQYSCTTLVNFNKNVFSRDLHKLEDYLHAKLKNICDLYHKKISHKQSVTKDLNTYCIRHIYSANLGST